MRRMKMKGNRRNKIKHTLAAIVFSMVMCVGITCFADEVAVKAESAKIRATADPSSEQVGSTHRGKKVDIISQTTGTDGKVWYQVYVDANTKGYIRSDLVETPSGTIPTTSTAAPADQTTTTATPTEAKQGTVKTNSRIREGASTNHGIVASVNPGIVLTITGETTGSDGKKWYQVSFKHNEKDVTGFIRADLVTFDNVQNPPAESNITGTGEGEGGGEPSTEPSTEAPPAEEPPQEQQPAPPANDTQNIELMNVEETPAYIMPEFKEAYLIWNEQKINAYKNGDFYIFYARKQTGEEGWYLFDAKTGVYQRYAYSVPDATVPTGNGGGVGMVPLIVLVVIIIVLIAIVGLLALKLREYRGYDEYEDDEDEDDEDDEDEDMEDLEDLEEDDPKPVRRPQPRPNGGAPQTSARRPQPQSNGAGQPTRRPATAEGQPARRPQPQSNGAAGQPARRPQPQSNGAGQPARRPQSPTGESVGRQQGQRPSGGQGNMPAQNRRGTPNERPGGYQAPRRPQYQNEGGQSQKGYKAKNMLENQEEDMDFMDL